MRSLAKKIIIKIIEKIKTPKGIVIDEKYNRIFSLLYVDRFINQKEGFFSRDFSFLSSFNYLRFFIVVSACRQSYLSPEIKTYIKNHLRFLKFSNFIINNLGFCKVENASSLTRFLILLLCHVINFIKKCRNLGRENIIYKNNAAEKLNNYQLLRSSKNKITSFLLKLDVAFRERIFLSEKTNKHIVEVLEAIFSFYSLDALLVKKEKNYMIQILVKYGLISTAYELARNDKDLSLDSLVLEGMVLLQNKIQSIKTETNQGKEKIILSYLAWGERYINFFIDYHLNSVFFGRNIEGIKKKYDVEFLIITDTFSGDKIRKYLSKQNATYKIIECDLKFFPSTSMSNFYVYYGYIDSLGVEYAKKVNGNLMFLPTDTIVSRNGLGNLIKSHEDTNADIVSAVSYVCIEEKIKKLRPKYFCLDELSLLKKTRDLLHQYMYSELVTQRKPSFGRFPRGFYVPHGDKIDFYPLFLHPNFISKDLLGYVDKIGGNLDFYFLLGVNKKNIKIEVISPEKALIVNVCEKDRVYEENSCLNIKEIMRFNLHRHKNHNIILNKNVDFPNFFWIKENIEFNNVHNKLIKYFDLLCP
tara:strand:- start:2843 stop:4597 length:1755 start_codon:yes stop_codon:yes gene_type:complete